MLWRTKQENQVKRTRDEEKAYALECSRAHQKFELTNDVFAQTDAHFIEACSKANTKPTKRQASKFRNHSGRAYKKSKEQI